MGFWLLKRKESTPEEKAARRARAAARDAMMYDSIMSAFVQPLPTFSQWSSPVVPRSPPSYDAATIYYPATYYPNQSYANPYGYQGYVSSSGSVASADVLPNYMDATYAPYSRQVRLSLILG
jgi:hypothetical protein